jgi:hypothetical protein
MSSNNSVNQVTVGTSATQIVAARTGRLSVQVVNHGTTDVFLGTSNGVTTGNGILLPGTKGASVTLDLPGALWGIVAAGTQAVSFLERY